MVRYKIQGVVRAVGGMALCLHICAAFAHGAQLGATAYVGRATPVAVYEPPATSLVQLREISNEAEGEKDAAVTGDVVADPFVIASLPFVDAQSTVGFSDDYNEVCPFPDSGAPDVVYSYTPDGNGTIRIDLCASSFDTRVYVYAGSVTAGSPYACNDDYCGSNWYRSRIPSLPVSAGTVYFIVVDGWGAASGNFQLSVSSDEACVWSGCSPGAIAEGEVCAAGTDVTNGGCNPTLEVFSAIDFDAPVCGEIWAELPSRDTDWYRRALEAGTPVRWKVRADFPVSIFVFDLANGCTSISGLRLDGDPCEEISITVTPEASNDFAFVVTTREQFGGYACADGPGEYEAVLEQACHCECHADPYELPGEPGTCDGIVDVFDITAIINSAFRGGGVTLDSSPTCPNYRNDVNCDNVVDVFDVTLLINVAFRGLLPGTQFCDPCAP